MSMWLADRSGRWTIEEDLDWLTVTPTSGDGSVARMTARVGVNHTWLAPGDHKGNIRVKLEGPTAKTLEVPVRLQVVDTVEVWRVGDRKQLFINDRFIEDSANVTLRMNPAQKIGHMLALDGKPWKDNWSLSCVFEENGKYKMYYGYDQALHYAESVDAIHWKTVHTKLITNIQPAVFVLVDPRDVPERRYKFFVTKSYHNVDNDLSRIGVYAYVSADGIHFTQAAHVFPMLEIGQPIAYWDERIGKYVIFSRAWDGYPNTWWEKRHGVENQRQIGRIVTDDLLKPWPFNKNVPITPRGVSPDHIQAVLKADEHDDPWSDIYYNATVLYPYAQDVYVMFPQFFRHFSRNRQPWIRPRKQAQREGGWEDYGLVEIQMAVSRDGIHWPRPDRRPYVPMGLADEWDRWLQVIGVGMVRRGNYLYQYCMSSGRTHDSAILWPEYDDAIDFTKERPTTGIIRQRLDGFVSADAEYTGGYLQTPPLIFSGNQLRLNIDTSGMGKAHVEIRDLNDRPIPGYTLAECAEVTGNFIDFRVRWNQKTDISPLAGRPIKLYFKMRGAKLYAFQFMTE